MPSSSITSMAILKVNWDNKKDFIDILVPFVAEVIRRRDWAVVSNQEVQNAVSETFGLGIPQNTIGIVLRRAAKAGYVNLTDGIYRPNAQHLSSLAFEHAESDAVRMHNLLVNNLRAFASREFDQSLTEDAAERLLLDYLSEFDIDVLSAMGSATTTPLNFSSKINQKYLVARFVNEIIERDPQSTDALESVVKGHMLANFVHFQETGEVTRNFKKTTMYFDTSFLIDALGYNGVSVASPCRELLTLLKKVGAQLACFEHTLQEIHGILFVCAERLERGNTSDAFGPVVRTLDNFIQAGSTGSDVRLEIVTLTKSLGRLNIKVQEKPGYDPKYVIDEAKLESILDRTINYSNNNPSARIRDVDSLAAIVRIRKNYRPNILEETRAVFITPNRALVRVAAEFLIEEDSPDIVPIAVTDDRLTNLAWLKKSQVAPELPRKVIMAQALAATQPSDSLWQSYTSEIRKLQQKGDISSDDFLLLRFSIEARQGLMEATHGGDDSAFSDGTIPEILERAKENVTSEMRKEFETIVQTLNNASSINMNEIGEREAALRTDVSDFESRAFLQSEKVDVLARKISDYMVKGVGVVIGVALTVGIIMSVWGFPSFSGSWLRYLIGLLQLLVLSFGFMSIVFGTSFVAILHRIEARLQFAISNKMKRWFGI